MSGAEAHETCLSWDIQISKEDLKKTTYNKHFLLQFESFLLHVGLNYFFYFLPMQFYISEEKMPCYQLKILHAASNLQKV